MRQSWWPGPGHGGERKLCACSSLTTDMHCLISGPLGLPGAHPGSGWVPAAFPLQVDLAPDLDHSLHLSDPPQPQQAADIRLPQEQEVGSWLGLPSPWEDSLTHLGFPLARGPTTAWASVPSSGYCWNCRPVPWWGPELTCRTLLSKALMVGFLAPAVLLWGSPLMGVSSLQP